MAIYSTQFICEVLGASNLTLYTVPSGFVVVVRSIELGDRSGSSTNSCTVFATAGGTIQAVITNSGNFPAFGSLHWDGRAVLNSGQSIGAGVGASTSVFVSGYLLSTP